MMVRMSISDYEVVVVGGGNGGLSAAALLKRRGCRDVAVVEPSPVHVYKPLQNYVGVGLGKRSELERSHGQPASARETALKPLFLACDVTAVADGNALMV